MLVPDSADDHESLYAYALPGIVMYARNTLVSACERADGKRERAHAGHEQRFLPESFYCSA